MRFTKKPKEEATRSIKLSIPNDLLSRFDRVNTLAEQQGYQPIELTALVVHLLAREMHNAERQLSTRNGARQ